MSESWNGSVSKVASYIWGYKGLITNGTEAFPLPTAIAFVITANLTIQTVPVLDETVINQLFLCM